jgi:hypothetical protein
MIRVFFARHEKSGRSQKNLNAYSWIMAPILIFLEITAFEALL